MAEATEPATSLARYGALVGAVLRERMTSEADDPYLAAPMRDYPERTGKALPSPHSPLFAPLPEPALRTGVTAMTDAALALLQ